MKNTDLLTNGNRLILFCLILLFGGLLSIYAVKGTFSRYAQDDYCYGYRVRTIGFWNTQIQSYFHKAEYVSDRYSTTLVESMVEELGGLKFVPYLTGLEILAWLAAMSYLFYQIQKLIFTKPSPLTAVLTGFGIVFFALYLAPDQYQILFWMSAMQVYFTPLILATFIFGRLLAGSASAEFKLRHAIELGLLSLFAGGFSETTTLLQFAGETIILTWAIARRNRLALAKNAIRPLIVMVFFTVVAMIVLAISPANSVNAPVSYHPDLVSLVSQSILYAIDYIWITLKGLPLPFLVVGILGAFIHITSGPLKAFKTNHLLLGIVVTWLIMLVTSFVSMLPSMYVTSHYPGERALFPAEVSLVMCVFLTGWISAGLIRAIIPGFFSLQTVRILVVLLGLALIGYIAHVTPRVYEYFPELQARAQAWDARQNLILQEKAAGIKDVIAPAFDSIFGITELHYEPDNWVNQCAAAYYGVQSISTADNYAGITTHPIGR